MSRDAVSRNVAKALQRALELHQAGRLAEAEACYRQVLAQDARHYDALRYLGLIKAQTGQHEAARELIGAAVQSNPHSAEAHLNLGHVEAAAGRPEAALHSYDRALALLADYPEALYGRGNALMRLGRHEEAVASYDKALALVPGRPEVLTNRGNALHDLKRYEEAAASYDKALALLPGVAMLHNNRGNTLRELKRYDEALVSLERALDLEPDYIDALINRGNVLQDRGRFEEALACFDKVLAMHPDHAAAHNYRGNALHDLRQYEAALASYERAVAIEPGYAEAHNNCGIALLAQNRPEAAFASFDRAVALDPGYAEAFNNAGNALRDLKKFEGALASYDRALAIRPDYAEALYNRGHALNAMRRHEEASSTFVQLLEMAPDTEYLPGDMLNAQLQCCDWSQYAANVGRIEQAVGDGKKADVPFSFLAISSSAANQLRCARTYAAARYPVLASPVWQGERYGHGKIRIAYLSADFHLHATAYLMAGLFERHDRSKFETTALSFGPDAADAMRARLETAFDRFVDVRAQSGFEVATLLRELEIDIAVDLKGYTADCRTEIFAHRGAPVQVNYLGYPGTMGVDYIDYILADRVVIPEDQRAHYTEKVVYLPDTYQVNDSMRQIAEHTPTRAEAGLPETGFVFCSFNNNYKISPQVFDVWMRLLRRNEGSVLWLLEDNAVAVRNLRREAAQRGVAPQSLVFAPRVRMEEHLARHRLADLFLDTLPYNAHTTASDALWAGLPVLTCAGATFAGRVAGSLLHAIDLPELIMHSLEEYEALALDLATHPDKLAAIRARLAANRTTQPLFDTDRFRRHIEAAYITMWERQQRGEPPQSFAVEPIA